VDFQPGFQFSLKMIQFVLGAVFIEEARGPGTSSKDFYCFRIYPS
jgi:hypothetical protein